MVDIRKFMNDFNNTYRPQFNPEWFKRNDDDIINGMKQIILSYERDKYFVIKVLGFDVIKDVHSIRQILFDYYNSKTKNGKKIDNEYENINLRDSDIMLLRVRYLIKLNIPESSIHIDSKTGNPEITEGEVEALIMLPRYVNKYYFRILGNYYIPIFQIVDGSTYNNATSNRVKVQSITLKTNFMPIKLYKEFYELTDINSNFPIRSVLFTSYIFSKKTDVIKFLLGRYGFYGALEFLELKGIYVHPENVSLDPNIYYTFKERNNKLMVSVIKSLFDKDLTTQSFVCTILKNSKRLESIDDIYDPRYWVKNLGADFQSATLEKGISVLDSLESIYDIKIKQTIRLPIEDKADTYRILRWMIREFGNLQNTKDNLDISVKRPRLADEYLPAIYAMKISRGLYRISDTGKNITFKDVVRVVDTAPNYVLNNIRMANLINYVDLVNDNDAELALSFTYKGISGLGNQGTTRSAVPIVYRAIHPSQLGRLDLDSSSSSDPGLTGIICPMSKTYDGSFSDYEEPNSWRDNYQQCLNELSNLYNITQAIDIKKKLGLSYDYVKDDIVRETIESYQKIVPILDDNGDPIVIETEEDCEEGEDI